MQLNIRLRCIIFDSYTKSKHECGLYPPCIDEVMADNEEQDVFDNKKEQRDEGQQKQNKCIETDIDLSDIDLSDSVRVV